MPKIFRKNCDRCEIFRKNRNLSKDFGMHFFRKILKEISKYFKMYCEILRNRTNKNNATPVPNLYLIIPSGLQEVIFCILSQYFAIFRKILKFFKNNK